MRSGIGMVCLVFAVAGCAGQPDPAVVAAAEQIQKLGGTFVLQGTTVPIKPATKLPAGRLTITHVNLNQKQIRDEHLEKLKALTQLEVLNGEGSYLTDAGLAQLQAFPRLRELDLHKSQYISDKGLESLKSLTGLNKLEISYTRVTDQGIDHLTALKSLKLLYLTGTRVSGEGLKKLKAGLPNCEILK